MSRVDEYLAGLGDYLKLDWGNYDISPVLLKHLLSAAWHLECVDKAITTGNVESARRALSDAFAAVREFNS